MSKKYIVLFLLIFLPAINFVQHGIIQGFNMSEPWVFNDAKITHYGKTFLAHENGYLHFQPEGSSRMGGALIENSQFLGELIVSDGILGLVPRYVNGKFEFKILDSIFTASSEGLKTILNHVKDSLFTKETDSSRLGLWKYVPPIEWKR